MSTATSSSSTISPDPTSSHAYRNVDHPVTSFSKFKQMRDDNQLCDVSLRVGETVTNAHRLVLASASPYFCAMFSLDMAEKWQHEVELHDLDPGALQSLIEYSYTGLVVITEENVRELFSTSSFLLMDGVRDACSAFMMKRLRPTNCLGARRLLDAYSADALSKRAYVYALRNFEAAAAGEEFLHLSYAEVEDLVSADRLCVSSEECVYSAVVRWIKHDRVERLRYAGRLLRVSFLQKLIKQKK